MSLDAILSIRKLERVEKSLRRILFLGPFSFTTILETSCKRVFDWGFVYFEVLAYHYYLRETLIGFKS